jgi:hypothetical protein
MLYNRFGDVDTMIINPLKFSWSNFRWQILKDLVAMMLLLVLSFYVVYFTSQDIARVFFLSLLLLFLFSGNHYFWFAFFFIIAQGPGYFFADFSGLSAHRLPLYTFLPGMSFTPIDLFVVVAFLKALNQGRRIELKLRNPLLILLTYIVFSIAVTSVIYGVNVDMLAWNLRWLFYYSIIISFLYLIHRKKEMYRFILLIFPMVFFNLFTQIYYLSSGNEFINLFNPGFRALALNTVTGELRPVIGGGLLTFFSFISAIFLLVDKEYKFPKMYLYLVLVAAFFSVFLSATRLWFVIFAFIFVGYLLVSREKISSTIGIAAVAFLILLTAIWSGLIPPNLLLGSSWGRLQQVFYVVEGDVYAIDTARNRLIRAMPFLINIIGQNPFIGYGVSDIAMKYYDNDFGFLNTILMFGIIGFSLFIYFFFRLFAVFISCIKRICSSNSFRVSLKAIAIVWAGILIGYLTTWDFFTMYFYKIFFISILIAIVELFLMHAETEEICIKNHKVLGVK